MKTHPRLGRWTAPTLAFLVLVFLANVSRAASPIIYNFASDLQGWTGNETAPMAGVYTWNATGGSTGGGCMQVVFDGVTTTEIDPWVTLAAPINEAQYVSVSVHMKVDASSGTTGTGGSGGYGNLQAIFRDSTFSWDSMWHGAIFPPAANGWVTYTFTLAQPYKPAEQYLQLQLQGSAGYTGPVTVYIDNITITPLSNPWVLDAFTSDTSGSYNEESWTGITETSSLNTSVDAGGGFTPAGALQMDIAFPVAAQWAAWGQSWVLYLQNMDPSRFTTLEFDVMVDGANSTPFSDGSYGALTIAVRNGSYGGPFSCVPSGFPLAASFANVWTHEKLALPTDSSLTNSVGFDIEVSGNYMGPVRLYFDNFKLSKPLTLPQITSITPGTPGGAKMTVDTDGLNNPFDQEGICSPHADNLAKNFFWINQTPATYAFTITNFPAPAVAPGFDAHIYLVNGDSIGAGATGGFNYNETYSGVNWNAYDLLWLQIQNNTNGSAVNCNLWWKTNAPNSTATNGFSCILNTLSSANGTWALNFTDNTHGSITHNGTAVTNFILPDFFSDPNYTANFTPTTSMVHFGIAKGDANTNGVNNGQSALFQQVEVINSALGTAYNDSFSGPGLTANNAWQISEYYIDGTPRVAWQPYGTAWWIKWNTSESGWALQTVGDIMGSWTNVGGYSYVDTTGTNTFGAVPQTNLPAGNAGFFRLSKPGQ